MSVDFENYIRLRRSVLILYFIWPKQSFPQHLHILSEMAYALYINNLYQSPLKYRRNIVQFTICFVPASTSSAAQLFRLPAAHWTRATYTLLNTHLCTTACHLTLYRLIDIIQRNKTERLIVSVGSEHTVNIQHRSAAMKVSTVSLKCCRS